MGQWLNVEDVEAASLWGHHCAVKRVVVFDFHGLQVYMESAGKTSW
jgi:hypothetical protein